MRLEIAMVISVALSAVMAIWAAGQEFGDKPEYMSDITAVAGTAGAAEQAGYPVLTGQQAKPSARPDANGDGRTRKDGKGGNDGIDGKDGNDGNDGKDKKDDIPISERLLSGFAGKAYAPPGTWLSRELALIESPDCSQRPFGLEAVYPQGIDTGGPVDRAVQAMIATLMADAMEAGESLASSGKLCDYPGPLKVLYRGRPYRSSPSPGSVASVLFIVETFKGEGRGSVWYGSLNLLPDGRELTLDMLFPKPDASLDALWDATYRGFCREEHVAAPAFYGSQPCGTAGIPRPHKPVPAKANLDSIGHALVTSLGLTLILDTEEAWNLPEGPAWLDIPKEQMIAMGAYPKIWE